MERQVIGIICVLDYYNIKFENPAFEYNTFVELKLFNWEWDVFFNEKKHLIQFQLD